MASSEESNNTLKSFKEVVESTRGDIALESTKKDITDLQTRKPHIDIRFTLSKETLDFSSPAEQRPVLSVTAVLKADRPITISLEEFGDIDSFIKYGSPLSAAFRMDRFEFTNFSRRQLMGEKRCVPLGQAPSEGSINVGKTMTLPPDFEFYHNHALDENDPNCKVLLQCLPGDGYDLRLKPHGIGWVWGDQAEWFADRDEVDRNQFTVHERLPLSCDDFAYFTVKL